MTSSALPARPLREVFDSVGEPLGPSAWSELRPQQLKDFGNATYLRELPGADFTISENNELGAELVDGFLLVSMMLGFHGSLWPFRDEGTWALNYGLDRVRFVSPVYLGDRVRLVSHIAEVRERGPGRVLVSTRNRMEIEGRQDPAMVADWLALYVDRTLEGPA